jgi:three-Cys-motif partner protein
MTLVPASDGLPARQVHEWSDEKLFYVERYMDIFTVGMKNKWRLVYADFFAGPGICVDEKTGHESLGSPLRAVARSGFDRIFLNDADPEAVDALRRRIPLSQQGRIRITKRDCNQAVEDAIQFLFPAGSERSTLGLAFIDPTAFQMNFDSIQRLCEGRRIDLIITFMTGYIRRFGSQESLAKEVDGFVGGDGWRSGRTNREWLDSFEEKLTSLGYRHVDDDSRILNSKRSTLYHLVFASKDARGADFFRKISQREYRGQGRLPFS